MTQPITGTLRLPARVHFGYGSREQLPELLALHGVRVLAIVDPFLLKTAILDRVLAGIEAAGLLVEVFSDVEPELPAASLAAGARRARAYAPDVILAVGGGSAIDAAKAVALLVTHGGPLSAYYGENAVPGPSVPIVAVPTTAGTGSEVTPVAVVSDAEHHLKVGISSPYLVPAAAVVDPEFTLGAPAGLTAHSGIDALVHLVESYTAAPLDLRWDSTLPVSTGRNAFAEILALQGIQKLGWWLPVSVADASHRRAHEEVAFASLLGGIAFGPTGTHLSHALQYPIGALTGSPHGLGTGLLLPYVLEGCRGSADLEERLAAIGAVLGSGATSPATRASDSIAALIRLNRSIGLPASLAELGITEEQLPAIADLALRSTRLTATSPAPATRDLLLGILRRAHAGRLSERGAA
ncbi:iron-containing alcohol dehydrogenase [Naasia aerilata]|uniref:Alcohol dehydrogenase n=1 Tax=Naasia aerilata TaxID=1162966 RepID=A0ABM8GBA4_9MICO|nr:iron-containing alcohol dehydrogenase [Naasia aerilata]BDZ45494.1 alcohol dehydrogenase [Naasia aerilata]